MRCEVEIEGLDGIRHRVEVDASSLHEAAAMGVRALRQSPIPIDTYPLMSITVKVFPPPTLHVVRYDSLKAWAESTGSPNEMTARNRVKKMLAEG